MKTKIKVKENAVRNATWGILNRLVSVVAPFILRTIIIYKLGNEYAGLNSLFKSILQVLNLSELGIGSAIVFNMYKPIAENDKKHICALLNLYKKLYFCIGIFILCIGLLITPFIPKLINGTYPKQINLYIVYLAFLFNTVIGYIFYGYKSSIVNAYQRNDIELKINSFTNLILYLFSSILILLFKNYYYYLIIMISTTIVNNLLLNFYTKKIFPELDCNGDISKSEKQEIKKNVVALMCHKIGSTVLNSSDNIVISAFLGLTMLTKYNNYYYIMNAVSALIMTIYNGLTGGIGNSFEVETKEKNTNYFKILLFLNAYLTIISGVILFSTYQDFITIWVGKKNLFSELILVLFIIYFYVHIIRRTIIVFRDATGMWWDNRFQPIISALLNLTLNIILVNYIGIYGILISTIIAMILIDVPMEAKAFCGKKINMSTKEYFGDLIKYFLILSLACIICYITIKYIQVNILIKIIVDIFLSFSIGNIIFYIFFRKKSEYIYFVNELLNKIKSKLKLRRCNKI